MSTETINTCMQHPNDNSTVHIDPVNGNFFRCDAGESNARFYTFIIPRKILSVSSVTAQIISDKKPSGRTQIRWFWDNEWTVDRNSHSYYSTNTGQIEGSAANSYLSSHFNQSRQFLVCRYAMINDSGTSYIRDTIRGANISVTGTFADLNTITSGTQIYASDIAALKTYINDLASIYQVTGYQNYIGNNIIDISSGNTIYYTNLDTHFAAANNTLPHVSGLSNLLFQDNGTTTTINASQYNTIVNTIKPPMTNV